MRNSRGFTLIEMLVVVLIIIILIGIGLAVGEQVQASSELALTKSELKGLQGALEWYQHKTAGQTPTDMLAFLEGYQRLHAYQTSAKDANGNPIWAQHKNFLTNLPATAVVTGTFPAPGAAAGGQTMTGVIEILDGLGHPIQYVPATDAQATTNQGNFTYPFPVVAGGTYSALPYNITNINGQIVYAPTFTTPTSTTADAAPMPLPSQVHAPCFFSFGTGYNTSNPSAMVYNSYTYSYNP